MFNRFSCVCWEDLLNTIFPGSDFRSGVVQNRKYDTLSAPPPWPGVMVFYLRCEIGKWQTSQGCSGDVIRGLGDVVLFVLPARCWKCLVLVFWLEINQVWKIELKPFAKKLVICVLKGWFNVFTIRISSIWMRVEYRVRQMLLGYEMKWVWRKLERK